MTPIEQLGVFDEHGVLDLEATKERFIKNKGNPGWIDDLTKLAVYEPFSEHNSAMFNLARFLKGKESPEGGCYPATVWLPLVKLFVALYSYNTGERPNAATFNGEDWSEFDDSDLEVFWVHLYSKVIYGEGLDLLTRAYKNSIHTASRRDHLGLSTTQDKILGIAVELSELTKNEKVALPQERLGDILGKTPQTIGVAIDSLCSKGYLRLERRGSKSSKKASLYSLNVPKRKGRPSKAR